MWTALALAACSNDCPNGVGCEESWPSTRLVIASGDTLLESQRVLDIEQRLEGTRTEGNDWSVAIAGGLLVVGMPDLSAVWVVHEPKDQIQSISDASILQHALYRPSSERFGTSVAVMYPTPSSAPEVWVGAPGAENGAGAVYRFTSVEDLDGTIDDETWTNRFVSEMPADGLGSLVARCSDVTGDLLDDPVFFAPRASVDPTAVSPPLNGRAWLLASQRLDMLESDATLPEHASSWTSPEPGSGLGRSVNCDRDLTGDGLADLVLGLPLAGGADAGEIHVIPGGADLASPRAYDLSDLDLVLRPDEDMAGWFGMSLATRSDDAVELVVGAPGYSGGIGRVAVYPAPITAGSTPTAWFTGETADRQQPFHFGAIVATGELDDHPGSDLFVGAPRFRNPKSAGFDSGNAWIWSSNDRFRWSTDAVTLKPSHEITGVRPFLRIGQGVTIGDLHDDGIDELMLPVRGP